MKFFCLFGYNVICMYSMYEFYFLIIYMYIRFFVLIFVVAVALLLSTWLTCVTRGFHFDQRKALLLADYRTKFIEILFVLIYLLDVQEHVQILRSLLFLKVTQKITSFSERNFRENNHNKVLNF